MKAIILALMLIAWPVQAVEFAFGPSGQEQVISHNMINPAASWSGDDHALTRCIHPNFQATNEWAVTGNCTEGAADLISAKGVWLTAVRLLVTTELANTSTGSCEFRLTTDDGSTVIAGSTLDAGPGSGNVMAEGTVYEATFNHRLAAGEDFQIQVRNGDQCANGTCLCETFDDQQLSIWGRF